MTDPRIPENKKDEAALPDALDQNPAASQVQEEAAEHGSEDAQLIAEDAGRTND